MSIEIIFEEESDLDDLSTTTIFNLADCCRTCLQHECSLTPINSSDSDSIKFCDKLVACVSGMTWAKEDVPSFICGICIEKLRIAYDFQTTCLQSDRAVQLQAEANEIQSSRSVSLDPMTTTGLAGCDETIEKVILTVKSEETKVQLLSQCTPVTSAATQLEATQTVMNHRKHGCQLCYINESGDLMHGIHSYSGEGPFACSCCDKTFARKYLLNAHLKTHTSNKLSQCQISNKSCTKASDFSMHMKTRTREKFCCKLCGLKFTQCCSLSAHMKRHASDKRWQCQICKKSYTKSSLPSAYTKTRTGEKFCKSRGQKFAHSVQLPVRMREHIRKQLYKCTLCRKVYNHAQELGTHMMKHSGEKLTCSCGKKFSSRYKFNRHIKTHTDEKLNCSYCGRIFAYVSQLKVHVRMHTGEKPLGCEVCGKKFAQSSSLNVHMKTHTGQKYSCKLCDKKFTQSSPLKVHMRKHTGQKYSCKLCDKKFTHRSSLYVHMKIHTGQKYSCTLCANKFTQISSLNAHMKRHTGDKPWQCQICNKSYISSSLLAWHVKQHTGKKFSCKLCDKQYTRSDTLNAHIMKKHSGEKP